MGCIVCGRIVTTCAECSSFECRTPLCRECEAIATDIHEDPVRVGTARDSRRIAYLPED
jgi:hypothetical protein